MAPLREAGTPIAELVRPVPYVAVQSMLDGGAPHGRHYYWKSHRLPGLPEQVVDQLVGRVQAMTSPFSQVALWAMGGAVSRVDPAWPPSDPDGERHTAWVREGWEALRPHSVGTYVNFLSDEGAAGIHAAYGGRLRRLTALKDRWDPTNFFRMNANVPPSRR